MGRMHRIQEKECRLSKVNCLGRSAGHHGIELNIRPHKPMASAAISSALSLSFCSKAVICRSIANCTCHCAQIRAWTRQEGFCSPVRRDSWCRRQRVCRQKQWRTAEQRCRRSAGCCSCVCQHMMCLPGSVQSSGRIPPADQTEGRLPCCAHCRSMQDLPCPATH